VAAYGASKAALDEILHSWRSGHPELSILRVGIGPMLMFHGWLSTTSWIPGSAGHHRG
jgi:hypothetical protein